jgi:hypothetical protein
MFEPGRGGMILSPRRHAIDRLEVSVQGNSIHADLTSPMAGKIPELMRTLKARHGDRNTKPFQSLNDPGAPALGMHIGGALN